MQAEWWAALGGAKAEHSVGDGSRPAANKCTGGQRGRTWLPSLSLPLKLRSYLPSSPAQGLIIDQFTLERSTPIAAPHLPGTCAVRSAARPVSSSHLARCFTL